MPTIWGISEHAQPIVPKHYINQRFVTFKNIIKQVVNIKTTDENWIEKTHHYKNHYQQ